MKCMCTAATRQLVSNGEGYRCLRCGARIPSLAAIVQSDAEAIAASKVDPATFYGPITITKEQMDAVPPSLLDAMRKDVDQRIRELSDRLTYPAVFVRTPVVDISMRADPTLQPGEVRIEKQPGPPRLTAAAQARRDAVVASYKPPTVETPWMRVDGPPPDPLDVKYDGVTLRLLLDQEQMRQRTERPRRSFEPFTPAQRSAVSAHWSAELRARVEASKDRERRRVVVDLEEP